MHLTPEDEQRFWSNLHTSAGAGSCWPFTGYTDKDGYGRFHLNGAKEGAHRIAHFIATGEEPPVVRHACDNPACCRPAHLKGGTQADNMADKVRKGRQAKGSANGRSKLDPGKVRSIRERRASDRPPSYRALAREYGVGHRTVMAAAKGETWKEAGGPIAE